MRIDPHQAAGIVGIAVAGAGQPGLYVAEHGTGIAADPLVVGHG